MTAGRRVLRNFGILASGRVVTAVLNLAALSIMARALPLDGFGIVVLLHVYLLTVRGVFNLKPFLAIVRYGVAHLEQGETSALAALFARCRRIDRASALAATLTAVLAAPLVGRVLRWEGEVVELAMICAAVLLVSGTGSAAGVLRLFDRFGVIARQLWVGPSIRCAGAGLAWWLGGGLTAFIAIWAVSLAGEYGYLHWAGRREAAERGLLAPAAAAAHGYPDFARFLGAAWVQTQLDMVPNRLATLMVGAAFGAAEAGLFRAARECASVLSKPTTLLRQVAFPDLARLWASDREAFAALLGRVTLVAGGVGLALAGIATVIGGPILAFLFGPEFEAAAGVLAWLLVAAALELGGAAMRPAGYAMGLAGRVLGVHLLATAVLLVGAIPLSVELGLSGVAAAVTAMMLTMLVGLQLLIRAKIRAKR